MAMLEYMYDLENQYMHKIHNTTWTNWANKLISQQHIYGMFQGDMKIILT